MTADRREADRRELVELYAEVLVDLVQAHRNAGVPFDREELEDLLGSQVETMDDQLVALELPQTSRAELLAALPPHARELFG